MEEKQIEREVLPADLNGKLGADEAEVAAQFGDEPAQIAQQGSVQIRFGMTFGEAEEL